VDPRRAVIDGDVSAFIAPRGAGDRRHDADPTGRAASRSANPVGGWTKRTMDLLIAPTALILLAPIICLIAIWIKVTMGGPVLFSHRRVGHDGKMFGCLKFRTMVQNADEVLKAHLAANPEAAREWAQSRKLRDDPRVTALGELLRKSSLDEIPQFLNVLRGEMSCVGPRPVMLDELVRYGLSMHEYLCARPGLTGRWQVSGRSDLDYETRVRMDADYVREWRLWHDIEILLLTIPAVLGSKGSR
jgi:exopolysaccharide production protein ExoY